ncbi:biopolymer transporter ExbD [Flavobacterium amnicola]|jgi:biopolymer transport protein ExbD|uniref:Biopolymer transporter ExbD n=1 Tax=Flavobacterium amnicola TaxID=2506422 RepID=A0A4Q1K7W9_9FLAO|nr:biopolymer transporter ExbD [Flavobacterium amnicola]RXR21374.1 biopolymer transporter ExbD [Flavobacterium amnicola]
MAELNTDGGGDKKGGKVRSKKSNSKVDLTAMVDLAFLLITFFMLTTSLSKPQSMNLGMPDKKDKPEDKEEDIEVADNRTMTILLGENNKVKWYMGQFTSPLEGPKDSSYGKEGIRNEILSKMKSVPEATGDVKKGLIVILKLDKKTNYKNMVDILDEMAIAKVPTYAIVDLSPEEKALLAN